MSVASSASRARPATKSSTAKEHGLEALTDRPRRSIRYANQLPAQIEGLIVSLKRDKPHWGARKIRELLVRRLAGDVRVPAKSTIHAVLDRHGLVKRMARPRQRATGTPLSAGAKPNDLWCADFKGEFKLGNGRYCYPLTVTDHASRFLLLCEALESTREHTAVTAFERLFAERGLPLAIRSDNGIPFASPNALFNLSKLSVWWLRLGIAIERIKPGQPQQNGRHERMHLTLKKEATRPPGMNCLQQQARFDAFLHEFNVERPHEALAMKCPPNSMRLQRGLTTVCLTSPTRCMTVISSSPPAAASVCTARKSSSQPCWQARASESRKSTTAFGSSALCNTISAISIWSRKPCSPSTTRSAPGCHPCLRYVPLPMSPGWTMIGMVGAQGLEPWTR
jgi:transposase InsO family protein